MSARIRDFDDFVNAHAILLASSGIPPSLYHQLFLKLSAETFDGGDYFQVEPCENGRQRRLLLSSDSMSKQSNVFLIDHAWTFRLSDARKQLQEVPGLAERMASLMCVDSDSSSDIEAQELGSSEEDCHTSKESAAEILERELKASQEKGPEAKTWLELDELDIDDDMLSSMDLANKFPRLIALSLWGNKLKDVETVVQEVKSCQNLKVVWLNENPVIQNCNHVEEEILKGVPGLEIYNSRFTSNFGERAFGFCAGLYGMENPCSSGFNEHTLEGITNLNLSNRWIRKLCTVKEFTPAEMPVLSSLNLRGNPLDLDSCEDLLKLLQRFTSLQALEVDIPGPLGKSAVKILESLPNLSLLNGVNAFHILEGEKHVIDSMLSPHFPGWSAGEPLVDRVISAMWLYLMTYRLADEEKIDETSVWYVMDEFGSALRHSDEPNCRIAPFLYMPEGKLASAVRFSFWHSRALFFEYEKYLQQLCPKALCPPCMGVTRTQSILPNDGCPLKVYTDIPQVEEFLTRTEFVIACLVMKHHLAETIHKSHGSPRWLQPTYNLETHLSQLIGDYFVRKRDGLNNLWILKPWNMARTIDTTVTGDISAIIRLMETGPKICQKYIEHPTLFKGRKFDLRYIVLVRSMNPLEIFLSDVFWVRLGNNPYSLDKSTLFDYETHFTVMNYIGRLNHMYTPEFVMEFEKEHQVKWSEIHERIRSVIRAVFESAAIVHPEMHSSYSRAMYGVDVMLDSNFQPKILEVRIGYVIQRLPTVLIALERANMIPEQY
ncbi:hypothetical protein ACLOJK_025164 [Asimina triloba]